MLIKATKARTLSRVEARRVRIRERDGHRCRLCGTPVVYIPSKSSRETPRGHIDHIIPRAFGGTDEDSNLQLLCGPCNHRKWAHTREVTRQVCISVGDLAYLESWPGSTPAVRLANALRFLRSIVPQLEQGGG